MLIMRHLHSKIEIKKCLLKRIGILYFTQNSDSFLEEFQLLIMSRRVFLFLSTKNLDITKLFVGDTKNTDITFWRHFLLYPFHVYLRIFHTGTMTKINR